VSSDLSCFVSPSPYQQDCRFGFASIPCGPDGPEAWAIADTWERRWQMTRRGEVPSPAMV
jgi:hypothetical protein